MSAPPWEVRESIATRALEVLKRIETGELVISVEQRNAAENGYSGIERYDVGGWTFYVFNDCDEWDYLEWVQTPEGEILDYEDMPERLRDYQPPLKTARAHWGLEP